MKLRCIEVAFFGVPITQPFVHIYRDEQTIKSQIIKANTKYGVHAYLHFQEMTSPIQAICSNVHQRWALGCFVQFALLVAAPFVSYSIHK